MFFGRLLNRIDRKTATPSVPPICRKNVADAVPTPMSRGETAFWMASTSGCRQLPRPRPKMSITIMVCQMGVSAPTCANSSRPTSISEAPMIGKTRYLPVREMIWPDTIEPVMMPSVSGSSCRPACVGRRALDDLQVERQHRDAAEQPHAQHDVGRRC